MEVARRYLESKPVVRITPKKTAPISRGRWIELELTDLLVSLPKGKSAPIFFWAH
jgi:hypothetical protein